MDEFKTSLAIVLYFLLYCISGNSSLFPAMMHFFHLQYEKLAINIFFTYLHFCSQGLGPFQQGKELPSNLSLINKGFFFTTQISLTGYFAENRQ